MGRSGLLRATGGGPGLVGRFPFPSSLPAFPRFPGLLVRRLRDTPAHPSVNPHPMLGMGWQQSSASTRTSARPPFPPAYRIVRACLSASRLDTPVRRACGATRRRRSSAILESFGVLVEPASWSGRASKVTTTEPSQLEFTKHTHWTTASGERWGLAASVGPFAQRFKGSGSPRPPARPPQTVPGEKAKIQSRRCGLESLLGANRTVRSGRPSAGS